MHPNADTVCRGLLRAASVGPAETATTVTNHIVATANLGSLRQEINCNTTALRLSITAMLGEGAFRARSSVDYFNLRPMAQRIKGTGLEHRWRHAKKRPVRKTWSLSAPVEN